MNLFVVISVVIFLIDTGYTQKCELSDFPPISKSGCCGLAVGGDKTSSSSITRIGEYPWMGSVEYKQGNELRLLCGAALISGRYVLSAGSCFSTHALKTATPVSVRLGHFDIDNDGPDCINMTTNEKFCSDGAISIPIDKIKLHPDFNINNTRQNDIALIRLLRLAPYTDFIRPICMPSLDITQKAPKNLYMAVAGWGAVNATGSISSNVLRRVHVPYVDFYHCRHKYNTTWHTTLTNGQLCAGSKNRDSCQGDSGGPLMLLKGQTTELAGIVSFGPHPCGQDIPSVYTKVFAYNDWIKTIIETDVQMSTTASMSTSPVIATKKPTHSFDTDLIVFRE